MYRDENKRFLISLSSDSYMSKEETKEAVGTTMRWNVQTISMGEMLDYCVTGHTYCNLFHDDEGELFARPFQAKNEKINNRFSGSDFITIDVDDFEGLVDKYSYHLPDFIKELSDNDLEPSLWFTSYSHNPSEGLLKAHLIYVFDSTIPGKDGGKTYQAIAKRIEERITEVTGVPIDPCSNRCAQCVNGTNVNNPELFIEKAISYNVYEFTDFGFDDITTLWETNVKSFKPKEQQLTVSKWLIRNLKESGIDSFLECYGRKYSYFYRTEDCYEWYQTPTGCWYAFIDSRYFSLFYNHTKVIDGQQRRKKVYERMCERRLMHPTASPNQIAYCAVRDIKMYFDNSDDVFNYEYIQRNVNNCFSLSIDEIEKKYSRNIAKLKERAPKSGVIFRYKCGMTPADKAKERQRLRMDMVFSVYDITMSPTDNAPYLNTVHNITISVSTLYTYFKECNIDYKVYKIIKQEKKKHDIQLCLSEMTSNNISITVRSLKEYLKTKEVKASTKDCCDAITDFKSVS